MTDSTAFTHRAAVIAMASVKLFPLPGNLNCKRVDALGLDAVSPQTFLHVASREPNVAKAVDIMEDDPGLTDDVKRGCDRPLLDGLVANHESIGRGVYRGADRDLPSRVAPRPRATT
jgi:hypothetical protein